MVEDLRGRFNNRLELYRWAFKNLFPLCKSGLVVCMEPEWQRSEFTIPCRKAPALGVGSSQYKNLARNDLLIAGPSGAGYVIPPLAANLPAYLKESARLCDLADIRVTTSYNGDPAMRVVKQHGEAPGKFLGFLAGYFHLGRTPMYMAGERPFVAYAWPHAEEIPYNSEKTLEGIRKLLETSRPKPCFIACHLFAYNTTLADIYAFVKTLDPKKVKVVRADEFLFASKQFIQQGEKK